MSTWIDCGEAFIVSDVVRWTEPVYAPQLTPRGRPRKNAKPVRIGEREVAGQVLTAPDARGFLTLQILLCREISAQGAQPVPMLRTDEVIRRKKTTLTKGKVHRLAWSDEDARRSVVETPKAD